MCIRDSACPLPRDESFRRYARQLGRKVNNSPLKYSLSLLSACVTLLINGDEDINPNVSAWVFPVMLVLGGLVMLADSYRTPLTYSSAFSSKSELAACGVQDFGRFFTATYYVDTCMPTYLPRVSLQRAACKTLDVF